MEKSKKNMKWFKHETTAHTNLKLQAVIEKFGMEGYGYYWACAELIGLQGTDYCLKSEKNWKIYLKKQTNISTEKQDKLLEYFTEINLIDKKALKNGDLFIPKLQERSDDYTKKVRRVSEQDTDNVPLEEKRIDKKRIEETPLPNWLNKKAWDMWVNYKKEKKQALKPTTIKFQLSILEKNIQDHTEIIRNSITNGWTGLFPLKKNQPNTRVISSQKRAAENEEAHDRQITAKDEKRRKLLLSQTENLANKMTIKP